MAGEVSMRDVEEGDLPAFFEHQRDPDAGRMAAFPARDWDAFVAHWLKIIADETGARKTILFDGQVAGNVVIWGPPGERNVGYWIGKEYWGKGVATRALSELLAHAGEDPLFARVAKHNAASIRVLQKCGFTVVGEDTAAAGTGGEPVEEWILKRGANDPGRAP